MISPSNSAPRTIALALLALACLAAVGCEHNVYELNLQPRGDKLRRELTVWRTTGDDKPRALSADELARLAQVYGRPAPEKPEGKQQFTGEFARRTPGDIGGNGWFTRWETSLGSLTGYLEQFRGRDDLAAELKARQQLAGRLVDFFRDWLTKEVGDDPRAAKVRAFMDGEFRHDIENLVLYVWSFDVAQGSPESPQAEELLLRLLAYFAERGYVSPESLPAWIRAFQGNEGPQQGVELMLKAVASKSGILATEAWPEGLARLRDHKALRRSLVAAVKASDLPALADKIAAEEDPVIQRSKEETEEQKADGTLTVLLFQVMAPAFRFESDEVRVRYSAARPPLKTNGDWHEEDKSLHWNGKLSPHRNPRQPPYLIYAAWTTPNEEAQQARFGKVVLKDETLAQYCLWYHGLAAGERREWDMFLTRLMPGDDHRAALVAFRFAGEEKRYAESDNKAPVSGRVRELILPGL